MGYGQLVYRRVSGIYVARLCVPQQFRDRVGRREIHVSTGRRSRHDALSTASAIAQCWRDVFSDLTRLDALKVVSGSPLLIGEGIIFLVDAAAALGMEPLTLALELTNRGSGLMANADGWSACDVADIGRVDREDGYHLWQSLQAEGQECSVNGLVTLLDASSKVLALRASGRVSAWRIHPHEGNTSGEVFVEPGSAWLEPTDLVVRKGDVEALRVAAASAITVASLMTGAPAPSTSPSPVATAVTAVTTSPGYALSPSIAPTANPDFVEATGPEEIHADQSGLLRPHSGLAQATNSIEECGPEPLMTKAVPPNQAPGADAASAALGCWRRPKTEPQMRVVPTQN